MIRDDIKAALVTAMKSGDKTGTATLRLIQSSLKNRDIEMRGATAPADDHVTVTEVLQKMIKQRRESVALYEQGGRQELADAETAEIAVIEGFLPRQMDEEEAKAAIDAIVAESGASSLKDMGRVMAAVKERHAGAMDMSKASALVKARLSA
ncbi:MAG: GatB/YqeY domain-containing protein [Allosphingosinicella sp.]